MMTVSVVIPVYNVKPYLERCVHSVLRQTYKNVEIILVDDGSTDGSAELCDLLGKTDPRIMVIHQENQGLSGARNTGIHHATGEYIAFLDSDDEWLLDDGLNTLVKKGGSEIDLILFKTVDIWKNGRIIKDKGYDIDTMSKLHDAQSVFSHLVVTQQFRMSACFLLVHRELLVSHEIYFPVGFISEDLQWSLHLWQYAHKVSVTNLYFYGYYHHANSISTTTTLRVYDSYDKIFKYWKEQCYQNNTNASFIRIYLANMWVSRGYAFYQLDKADKPSALKILKNHSDLLAYAATPKALRVKKLVCLFGVRLTVLILGLYWRLRSFVKRHVV